MSPTTPAPDLHVLPPALSPRARVVLTLRAVCGSLRRDRGCAFPALGGGGGPADPPRPPQDRPGGDPLWVPDADELAERLDAVLAGALPDDSTRATCSSGGGDPARRDLAEDAACAGGAPGAPAAGARAARSARRFIAPAPGQGGRPVRPGRRPGADRGPGPLALDREAIAARSGWSSGPARCGGPGPYQLQAAIAACHAEAPSWADTDWRQIVVLYDLLLRLSPSPVVRLTGRGAALGGGLGRGAGGGGGARRGAARLPPLPRRPRRAAAGAGPSRGGAERGSCGRWT